MRLLLKILNEKMKIASICLQKRNLSYKSLLTWYSKLVKPQQRGPPFGHIVQIGDPTLRAVCEEVPINFIKSPEVKYLLDQMEVVFNKNNCVGLSAPQIGVPLRVFMFELSRKNLDNFSREEQKSKEIKIFPRTVVFNPEVKITDFTKVVYTESCQSVKGFYADVPRFRGVELKGLDKNGDEIKLNVIGWLARIVQHEMDHLNGKIYTDIMDRKSLTCSCWEIINERRGKVELPYN